MNEKSETKETAARGPNWLHRLVRLLPIFAFDAETERVAGCYGCQTAEEQAALRYGKNWRADYRKSREAIRSERWPILSKLILPNVEDSQEG